MLPTFGPNRSCMSSRGNICVTNHSPRSDRNAGLAAERSSSISSTMAPLLCERECGLAAHALDLGIDADARDVGAIGDAKVLARAPRRRARNLGRRSAAQTASTRSVRRSPGASAPRLPPSAPSARSPAACPTPSRSGCVGTSPTDGRNPMTPQKAAGMRSDPPRSVPSASAIMPVASAAAPPPVDPPADLRRDPTDCACARTPR